MRRLPLVAALAVAAFVVCKRPDISPSGPNPTPAPTVEPSPPTQIIAPLEVDVMSNGFQAAGRPVWLYGAIICCTEPNAVADGWPLINPDVLERLADTGLNFTHIRLGPFARTAASRPYDMAYGPDGWNEAFWQRVRAVLETATRRGVWVEVDVVDGWVMENAASGRSPWPLATADCTVAYPLGPNRTHEDWIRKVVSETGSFPITVYQVGNESFDCPTGATDAWETGVQRIIRDELSARGFGRRLISTNSQRPDIESWFDYANRHGAHLYRQESYPVTTNEYPRVNVDNYTRLLWDSFLNGVTFHYWRGNLSRDQENDVLRRLAVFRSVVDQVDLRNADPITAGMMSDGKHVVGFTEGGVLHPDGTFTGEWISAVTGERRPASRGEFDANGYRAPDGGMWVLFLTRTYG